MGEYDHLVPAAASKPFNEVIPSDDTEIMEFSTGHIGLSVSSSTHADLWPDVAEWYSERNHNDEVDIDVESPEESAQEAVEEVADAASEAAEASDEATETDDNTSDEAADVDTVSGIGPTYADRLHDAGIRTVGDLAEYDPAELAEITNASPSQAQDWLGQL